MPHTRSMQVRRHNAHRRASTVSEEETARGGAPNDRYDDRLVTIGLGGATCSATTRLQLRRQPVHHRHDGADLHPGGQIDDVPVEHAEAARRGGAADRVGIVGAVNAIEGVAEIERHGAERVLDAAGHLLRQAPVAIAHLLGRMPVRPLGLAADRLRAGPGEALAAHGDRVVQRFGRGLDQEQLATLAVDDDAADGIGCWGTRWCAARSPRSPACRRPTATSVRSGAVGRSRPPQNGEKKFRDGRSL